VKRIAVLVGWVVVAGVLAGPLAGCKKPAEQARQAPPPDAAMKQGTMKRVPMIAD
jgi:hypothetical protein